MPGHALFVTLNDLAQTALALSGAIMGDPAGQIHPQLKQGIEEVTRLAGIAIDEAKGIPGVSAAATDATAAVPTADRGFDGDSLLLGVCLRRKMHDSKFI